MRHGEGFHNIGIVNEDAHLTEAGWRQAAALKKHIAGLTPALDVQVLQGRVSRACHLLCGRDPVKPWHGSLLPSLLCEADRRAPCSKIGCGKGAGADYLQIENAVPDQVVIVSPLMRALETAAGAFGGGAYSGSGRPLMLAQTAEEDERAAHAAVVCPEGVPFIAFEGCRERLGAPQTISWRWPCSDHAAGTL